MEADDVPAGVRQMEAIIAVWTMKWMVAAYILITFIAFVNSLHQNMNNTLNPFVTSAFYKHSLTPMTNQVAQIVSGVSKLPLAMFINICGRPHGFAICLFCVVIALIMMALCQNVETYAAAQVFYWTGINGMTYVIDIFIADTSLLKNRLIWFGIVGSPYICNTFASPKTAEAFIERSTWRWAYGSFAIITPFLCIPFWGIFWFMNKKATNLGIVKKPRNGRTFWQSFKHWFIEFDVIGLVLICAGFIVFLLPFSLATNLQYSWESPTIISMIMIGFVLLVFFGAWEYYMATKTFFPFYLMKNRSIVAACLLGFHAWLAFYSYKSMYLSYLQVVFDLSISNAGYILNIYNLVSATWAIIISLIFRWVDTYRWAAFIAVPVQIAMAGCLVKFRHPGTSVGLLVMVEVFYAMGAAVVVQIESVAVMATVPHQNMATGLALLFMMTSLGGAFGQAISGAIWTNVVLKKLTMYLPEDKKHLAPSIYGNLNTQMSFKMGSPEREATIAAFGDAQKIMAVVAVCSLVPCLAWVFMLKNIRLSDHRRTAGLQA
ncbi:major facilitator superfamily domain-containing protein [Ampelomyces quisqualis]|uniref:Major facilitator superfamily domain-containing protein n=1 Tax=Ampelomyces quisqualis TaxID=50730 RepID=A0A6A5R2W6_AMPQU|nr:major facilitator superfamily domain-containing protein [Ampelomyces quisqualis]